MTKIDFNKVEQALEVGLLKMTADHLLFVAELAATIDDPTKVVHGEVTETAGALASILRNLHSDLRRLRKQDMEMYSKLGIDKREVWHYFENPEALTPEDWQKIKQIRQRVQEYKKELRRNFQVSDQDIVAQERKKQVNSRFNVKNKWLPLK